ncbi:hypothetical protein ACER0C_002429 [Sarotherodon galilaeus]
MYSTLVLCFINKDGLDWIKLNTSCSLRIYCCDPVELFSCSLLWIYVTSIPSLHPLLNCTEVKRHPKDCNTPKDTTFYRRMTPSIQTKSLRTIFSVEKNKKYWK